MTEDVHLHVIPVLHEFHALRLHVMQGLGPAAVMTTHLLPNEDNTPGMCYVV